MASPIRDIKRMEVLKEKVEQENLEEILRAVSDNKDAVLSSIDLLATLHENGMMEMFHAFIKRKDDAMENIMTELNRSQYTGVLENIGQLLFFLGELKMDELQYFARKVNRGMTEANDVGHDEKTSYMDLFKALQDPEINRSITMLLQFLRGMGKDTV